jgi:hypothetical protein
MAFQPRHAIADRPDSQRLDPGFLHLASPAIAKKQWPPEPFSPSPKIILGNTIIAV